MRRSDVMILIGGAVVGVVVLLIGLAAVISSGGRVELLGFLLPLAVLAGGLIWAHDAASMTPASSEAPAGAARSVQPPPVLLGDPSAVDAPTVPPAAEVDDGEVSEAVRLRAAEQFPLESFLLDEIPDRIQCVQCGRYRSLAGAGERRVTCTVCGATRELSDVQPDTIVRLYPQEAGAGAADRAGAGALAIDDSTTGPDRSDNGVGAAAVREPSEGRADPPTRFAPPTPRGR